MEDRRIIKPTVRTLDDLLREVVTVTGDGVDTTGRAHEGEVGNRFITRASQKQVGEQRCWIGDPSRIETGQTGVTGKDQRVGQEVEARDRREGRIVT